MASYPSVWSRFGGVTEPRHEAVWEATLPDSNIILLSIDHLTNKWWSVVQVVIELAGCRAPRLPATDVWNWTLSHLLYHSVSRVVIELAGCRALPGSQQRMCENGPFHIYHTLFRKYMHTLPCQGRQILPEDINVVLHVHVWMNNLFCPFKSTCSNIVMVVLIKDI